MFVGLHIVDVSDPMNVTTVACNGLDGYVHDTECIIYDGPDARYNAKISKDKTQLYALEPMQCVHV